MRILIIDDEVRLTRHLTSALAEDGHDSVVVHDGAVALRELAVARFDLVVLDVGLPGLNGFDVLRQIRDRRISTRVLMLTARGELNDRLTGLKLGADDYLSKPFAMGELVARVNALGRRYTEEPALTLSVGDLTLRLIDHEARRGSRRIDLSMREVTLLKVLMREPGRVFTRTELCERVWEREHDYDMKLVEVFIGRLRRKLGAPPLIHPIRHVGYTIREAQPGASDADIADQNQ